MLASVVSHSIQLIIILGLLKFNCFVNQAEITVSKYPNRILVYSLEGGDPMFFDVDGRGTDILPTGTYYSSPTISRIVLNSM